MIPGDLNDVTFYTYQPLPPPNDVTFYAYQPDNTIAINAYQNDVTFYAYQPLPPPNDVHIDAYQPNNIAKKIEIGFSQNNLSIRVRSVGLEFLLPLKTDYPPFRFISLKLRQSSFLLGAKYLDKNKIKNNP